MQVPVCWLLVTHRLPAWIFWLIYHHHFYWHMSHVLVHIYFISNLNCPTCTHTWHISVMLNEQAISVMSIVLNVTLTSVSVYCTPSKRTLLRWRINEWWLSCRPVYPPVSWEISVGWIMVPTCQHCVQGKHLHTIIVSQFCNRVPTNFLWLPFWYHYSWY